MARSLLDGKFFKSPRNLATPNSPVDGLYNGRIIGRADSNLFLAHLYDERGNFVQEMTLSATSLHGFSWSTDSPFSGQKGER